MPPTKMEMTAPTLPEIPHELTVILDRFSRLHPVLVECWWVQLCRRRQTERSDLSARGPYPIRLKWQRDPLERWGAGTPLSQTETWDLLVKLRGRRFLEECQRHAVVWEMDAEPKWPRVGSASPSFLERNAWRHYPPPLLRQCPLLRPWVDHAWKQLRDELFANRDTLTLLLFKPLEEIRRDLIKQNRAAKQDLPEVETRMEHIRALLRDKKLHAPELKEHLLRAKGEAEEQLSRLRPLAEADVAQVQRELSWVRLQNAWGVHTAPSPAVRTSRGDWRRLIPDAVLFQVARSLVWADTDWLFAARQALGSLDPTDVHADTWRALQEVRRHGLWRPRTRSLADPAVPWTPRLTESVSKPIFLLTAYLADAFSLVLYHQATHPDQLAGILGEELARSIRVPAPQPLDPIALQNNYDRRFPRGGTTHEEYHPHMWLIGGPKAGGGFAPWRFPSWAACSFSEPPTELEAEMQPNRS